MHDQHLASLPLPSDYNPETYMVAKSTEYGLFHESRRAAQLAADLVANGAPEDLILAEKVLGAVLACQETDERDPHHGNFYWMREDDVVEDLNAVEFNLERLIPMMISHRNRLSPQMQDRVLDAIRLGLAEIEKLDVLVAYTNITCLDVVNTCLGGELLGDAQIARRGYIKLAQWLAFTAQSGHPLEYNSPTYTAVTLRAMKKLIDLVQDPDTRIRARAMTARLGISVALRIHGGTGRWAGPHGRAYHPSILCETPPEIEMLRSWVEDGTVPPFVGHLLDNRPTSWQITETAEPSFDLSLTTYQTSAYALGTASAGWNPQNNVCMVHYTRPNAPKPGVLYTRYVLNDKWFGDFYHATDRTKQRNLIEEGSFYGVQNRNRSIGIYGLQGNGFNSAKAVFIWTGRAQIDEIWVGERQIESLPVDVGPDETVVIGSGDVYMAVRPLHLTQLGRETPIRLLEREGDLVLELYNYQSEKPKRFWELGWPGAFYKGRPIVCYYLEVADRSDFGEGLELGRAVEAGQFSLELGEPFTYGRQGQRPFSVAYTRGGQEIGIHIDLMEWKLLRRWTEGGDLGWPMLEAWADRRTTDKGTRGQGDGERFVRQVAKGRIELGGASVECEGQGVWLCALPTANGWAAGHFGLEPTTLTLATPDGVVTVNDMGMGLVVREDGEVTVEGVGQPTITQG